MKEINVFIPSVGRRVELVQLFKKTSKEMNIKSNIIAGDSSKLAPALVFADSTVILPRIDDKNYIDSIIKACLNHNVSIIIPTIDTELRVFSENRKKIEDNTSAIILLSSDEVIDICRNKVKTQNYLEQNGFLIPKMYDLSNLPNNITFPLFIKPKDGSSSINAFKVNNQDELNIYLKLVDNPILQDCMIGDEYSVDVFLDLNSNIISIVPRLRIATRAGEILKGRIVLDKTIIDDVKTLMETIEPIGHITVQLMKTIKGIEYIEINPRFGGGAPMSIMAGANSCMFIYSILMGKDIDFDGNKIKENTYLRFDQSVCIKND